MKVTLQHHHNQTANPNGRPATFRLKDPALTTIDDTDIFPWLVLHHVEDKMIKVDDDNNSPARLSNVNINEEEGRQTAISTKTNFISLTPGESILFTMDLHITDEGILLEDSLYFQETYLY